MSGGVFLVRVDGSSIAGIRGRSTQFPPSSNPKNNRPLLTAGSIAPLALWKLLFLRDFGYDPDLMGETKWMKAVVGLRGVLRTSRTILNGRSFLNLDGFAPAGDWDEVSVPCGEQPGIHP
jgi:hypothetical protein